MSLHMFSWRNKKIIDTISDIWSNDQVPMNIKAYYIPAI